MKLKVVSADESPPKFFENLAVGWLSTNEVAKFLSTTPNAVRIMVFRGQLKASRIGARLKFRVADCEALLKVRGE